MNVALCNEYTHKAVSKLHICRGRRGHCPWRIFCHVEKFEMYLDLRCGKIYFYMWRYIRCRKFLDVEKFHMWIFFRYKEKHNSHCFAVRSVLLPCMLFCRKICSFEIYAVLLQNLFCRDLRTFYVEKNLAKNVVRGEKNDKYNVWICVV